MQFLDMEEHGIYITAWYLAYHVEVITTNQLGAIYPKVYAHGSSVHQFIDSANEASLTKTYYTNPLMADQMTKMKQSKRRIK